MFGGNNPLTPVSRDKRLRREERTARIRVALELVASIRSISRQANDLERELRALIMAYRPGLLAEQGLGVLTAATLSLARLALSASRPTRTSPAKPAWHPFLSLLGVKTAIDCIVAATASSTVRCT